MTQPAWTYSQLDSFESCPKKFYHLKVAKDVVDPPTVHTEWGVRVHKAFEDAIKDQLPLPEGMEHWQGLANKIGRLPGEKLTEVKLAIDKAFKPADWGKAWSRGIADLVVLHKNEAVVIDYKTGKRKPSEQLDLYANYVFHHHPNVIRVSTGFVWLKEKRIDWKTVDCNSVSEIWQALLPRVRKLESAYERDSWPARPSGLCKAWCPVTTCDFNGKRGARS